MMTAIPNQPINFAGSLLAGCLCDEVVPPLLIAPSEDSIIFQLGAGICPDAVSVFTNPDFDDSGGTTWFTSAGWTLSIGSACGSGAALGTLQESSLTPTPGNYYTLVFNVVRLTGTVSWTFAGNSGTFGTTGVTTAGFTFTTTVEARTFAGLIVTLDTADSAICFSQIAAYDANVDFLVELVDPSNVVLASFDQATDPDYFTFYDDVLAVNIPLGGETLDGCFTIRVTNTCGTSEVVLTSQTLQAIGDTDCTLKVRGCNDGIGLGFAPDPFEMRLIAKLTHPTWEYDMSTERKSNGRIMTNYADRQRKMELRIGLQSEYVHPFISALPVFGHFYIGQEEFVFDNEGYEPLYGDVFDGTGGIVLAVRPKEELFRRVQCEAEGPGCSPPPNYWVEGTGPNNDLVITEDDEAILINP